MKTLSTISLAIWCLLCMLPMASHALDKTTEKTKLYIGIVQNRQPYTYLDKEKRPKGILIERLNTLCSQIKADCEYVAGESEQLLTDLQTYRIQGMLIIDSFVVPDVDHIKLTSPLCEIKPLFLQRQNDARKKAEDFKGTTIGVGHGSLLHLYLLDEYSSLARIHPYLTLESGVFDLVSGRIDALFTDEAFFQARVAKTALASQTNPARLMSSAVGKPDFPATSMTLAVRERDQALLSSLEKAIKASGKIASCSSLLDKQQTDERKPQPEKSASTTAITPVPND
ncbi:substrate-binding periplasmic protein [Thiothrix nivea]|uniref:L-arginine-binding protein n=1 Tax=Thiothrix nivea (strain ATCC 35100 / DSM 5205 / JP2) TaxID=870187 RepID=A0A656HIR3_THINJ|nr:transporter substrate-binding domain-containing protein [Thiothrix nivea]EIJ36881.1 L-arginine-binding protein [Thiothrix nivea DSM 5205]